MARTTGVSNPIRSPSFCLLVSVSAQQSAFVVGVLSDLYAFHRSTENSLCPYHVLRSIIPDNACFLCLTVAAGTKLADAYSLDTVIASSPGKEVHDPSLGRVSVPVWLIILSDQLLIIALPTGYYQPFPTVVPLPRAGSYALLTRPPLETPLPVRLACVRHAASVHPEPGSNSP
ncbi:uncharacterized protein DS421_2g46980 [Arachis hypogaea]|nr:uncharacterized protein DS421_2g46980 [Arachis hypogaea]